MKKVLFIVLFILSLSAGAQVYLSGGVNSFNLTNVDESEAGFGFLMGINYFTPLGEGNTGFITGLELENNRSSLNGEFYGESFMDGVDFRTFDYSINCLKLPAYLNFQVNSEETFSIIGGLKFSFLLQDQQDQNEEIDYGLEFKKFNLGLGLGAMYIPEKFGAKVELQHSILPVIESETGSSLNRIDNIMVSNGFSVAFSFLFRI